MSIPVKALHKGSENTQRSSLRYIGAINYVQNACAFLHTTPYEGESYELPAQTGGGFVRSWKLNLRLTTRAEDSHAAPDSYVAHPRALLHAVRACSVVTKMAIRISNVLRRLCYFSSSLKVGKVYRGSSVYTACSTACKGSRQFL